MKKWDVISFAAIVASLVGLYLLDLTGMMVHILISGFATVVMFLCTILDKRPIRYRSLEIGYRLCFLLVLISGIVMNMAHIYGAVSIAHKVFAALFALVYVLNFVLKMVKK